MRSTCPRSEATSGGWVWEGGVPPPTLIFFGGHTWNAAIWRHFNLNLQMQDRSGATSRNPIWVTGSNVQTWKIFQIHGDHRWPGSVLHRNLPSKQYWAGVIIQISWYWSFPGWHCIFYHEWSMQKRTNTIEAYFKLIRSLRPLPYKASYTAKSIWPSHQANTSLWLWDMGACLS